MSDEESIPQEFKSLWLSLYRAALCGASADEKLKSPVVAEVAAEIADEALKEVRKRFFP